MATLTNVYTSGTVKGAREDLIDKVYRIAPEETIFTSNIGRRSVSNIVFDWQTDDLAPPDTGNARPEGNEFSPTAITPTVRLSNVCQISDKAFRISGTMGAMDLAGRASEAGYQYAKALLELKRDVEAILLSNQAKSLTSPRKTAALPAWVKTNVNMGTGGANPAGDGSNTRTDGTQRASSEALLKDVLRKCRESGGKPDMVMLGSFQKIQFSAFPGIAQIRKDVPGEQMATIIGAADVYVSDFGKVSFVVNLLQRPRDAWVIDTDAVRIAYLRPYEKKSLGPFGDTAAEILTVVEYGLQVDNEKALGLIADLQTS